MRTIPALLLAFAVASAAGCLFTNPNGPDETGADAGPIPDAPDPVAPFLDWSAHAGGAENDLAHSVAALPDGGAVVTGSFHGTFVAGLGQPSETSLIATSNTDIFILRYDHTGDLRWAKRAGGSGFDWVSEIAALSDGSVVVAGSFTGTIVFGQGEPGETALTSAGTDDVFLARYNTDGSVAWAKRAGGNLRDSATAVSIGTAGSIMVSGSYANADTGTAPPAPPVFGPGETNETTLESRAGTFLARYAGDGTLEWVRAVGTSLGQSDIAVLSDGSCAVVGAFTGVVTVGVGDTGETELISAGARDMLVAHYDETGAMTWARRAGGSYVQLASTIAALDDGSMVIGGHFERTITFAVGEPGQTAVNSVGVSDAFFAKYRADGTVAWAQPVHGARITSLAAGPAESIVMGVRFFTEYDALSSSVTFGGGTARETALSDAGDKVSIAVARFDTDGSVLSARRVGGGSDVSMANVAVVSDGSTVIAGGFYSTVRFGGTQPVESEMKADGSSDTFVIRARL